jgi:hypothetical protein
MKSRVFFLAGAMVMTMPACIKHPDLEQLVQQDVKFCPILQLESLDSTHPDATQVVVHYNAAGNPAEMLEIAGPNVRQDYHFRYDRFGRLTDYLMNPSITAAAFEWHTYTYPSRNLVVDSLYGENDPAPITAQRPNAVSFLAVINHFLDKYGRIIEDQETFNGISLPTTYFQYGADGNLIRNLPFRYDDKLNPYLTNQVWRFIYEDYSVNNYLYEPSTGPISVTQYNTTGLPQLFQGQWGQSLFNYEFFNLRIVYACDGVR